MSAVSFIAMVVPARSLTVSVLLQVRELLGRELGLVLSHDGGSVLVNGWSGDLLSVGESRSMVERRKEDVEQRTGSRFNARLRASECCFWSPVRGVHLSPA